MGRGLQHKDCQKCILHPGLKLSDMPYGYKCSIRQQICCESWEWAAKQVYSTSISSCPQTSSGVYITSSISTVCDTERDPCWGWFLGLGRLRLTSTFFASKYDYMFYTVLSSMWQEKLLKLFHAQWNYKDWLHTLLYSSKILPHPYLFLFSVTLHVLHATHCRSVSRAVWSHDTATEEDTRSRRWQS